MSEKSEKTMDISLRSYLGSGGMADVALYIDNRLNRKVAVKILRTKEKDKIARFDNEAKISAALHQENLPVVYNYLKDGERHWLMMEYIEGIDISEILRRPHHQRIPPLVAAMIMREVARALEYLHEQNIIHRDIKPGNVRLASDGQVKLMDFGIAKDQTSDLTFTSTGVIIGTPSYMSPEQASGDKITAQSDLFSLGSLTYEMVTGSKPFSGESNIHVINTIAQCRFKPVDKVNPAVPRELVQIIHKAMARNPSSRYPTAGEIIRDINQFLHSISQIEIKNFLKKYCDLVQSEYKPEKYKYFFVLPHLAFSQTSSMTPVAPKSGKFKKWIGNTYTKVALAGILAFILGLLMPSIYQFFKPVKAFGEPYGTVELALTSADEQRIAATRVWINEQPYALPVFFDGNIALHYFAPGWNSLKIRYPAMYQLIDYRFYFSRPSDTRSLKLNLDKLIREQDAGRYESRRYGFSVLTEPRDAQIILNNDLRNPFSKTPYLNTWPVFRTPQQSISVSKPGFKTFETRHQFSGDEMYLLKIDLLESEKGK